MRKMMAALVMVAATAGPMLLASPARADERHEHHVVVRRVYDPYRRDYHAWNSREREAYRAYLAERHRAYLAYERQRASERRAYWRWRHEREERLDHRR